MRDATTRGALGLCLVLSGNVQAGGLLPLDNPALAAGESGVYANAAAFAANDQMPLKAYLDDWDRAYQNRTGQNLAVGLARAESGVAWDGWRLGYVYRQHWRITASPDAVDLVWQDKHDMKPPPARHYTVLAQLQGFSASGARLSKGLAWNIGASDRLQAGMALSLLHGDVSRSDEIVGQLNGQGPTANATRQLRYTHGVKERDFNVYLADGQPSGQGYSLDVGLSWDRGEQWHAELLVNDLAGYLDWKDVPQSSDVLNNETIGYDQNGNRNAIGSRVSRRVDYRQNFGAKTRALLSWTPTTMGLDAYVDHWQGDWFPVIGGHWRFAGNWRLQADYDARFKSVGIALSHPLFQLGLRSDASDWKNASTLGVWLAAAYAF